MKYSVVFTTVRDIEAIKPVFIVSSPDAEIIIIDSNYNEKTKQQIKELEHDYCKVTYAPPRDAMQQTDKYSILSYKNDKMICHNTAFAYVEAPWVYKLDDCTELCPDFFTKIESNIALFQNKFKQFVIRPVKLESWMGHKRWDSLPSLKDQQGRYFMLDRHSYFETLDQFIFPIESMNLLNGIDERYCVGHGHEDCDIFQRYLTLDYKVILDKELKTFQIGHKRKIDYIQFTQWIYDITKIEILNGRYRAYNPFNFETLREEMLKKKQEYVL